MLNKRLLSKEKMKNLSDGVHDFRIEKGLAGFSKDKRAKFIKLRFYPLSVGYLPVTRTYYYEWEDHNAELFNLISSLVGEEVALEASSPKEIIDLSIGKLLRGEVKTSKCGKYVDFVSLVESFS